MDLFQSGYGVLPLTEFKNKSLLSSRLAIKEYYECDACQMVASARFFIDHTLLTEHTYHTLSQMLEVKYPVRKVQFRYDTE